MHILPTRPIPVLHIHGTEDGWIPYEGDDGFHSVDETIEYWVGANQCQASETSAIPDTDVNDDSTIEKTIYSDCLEGSSVVLYKVIGGGHTWPDMPKNLGLGAINRDINGGEEIWEFFEQYSLPDLLINT